MGVAVAAVWEEGTPDWAAYVGALPDPATEIETTVWASRHGCKLSLQEAEVLFPGLVEEFEALNVAYRW